MVGLKTPSEPPYDPLVGFLPNTFRANDYRTPRINVHYSPLSRFGCIFSRTPKFNPELSPADAAHTSTERRNKQCVAHTAETDEQKYSRWSTAEPVFQALAQECRRAHATHWFVPIETVDLAPRSMKSGGHPFARSARLLCTARTAEPTPSLSGTAQLRCCCCCAARAHC